MSRRHPVVLPRDRARPRIAPQPSTPELNARLTALIHPVLFAAGDEYRQRGFRARVLTLPVMVGLVLTMIWRQVASVRALAQLMEREQLFLAPVRDFTHQALNQRLRVLPADLFQQVLLDLVPQVQARAVARQRPLPEVIVQVQPHFPRIWAVDGSTLEEIVHKAGLYPPPQALPPAPSVPAPPASRDIPGDSAAMPDRPAPVGFSAAGSENRLGGTMGAMLDLATKLPVTAWFDPEATGNDHRFRSALMAGIPAQTLVVMDGGFFAFPFFDWCTDHGAAFIIPARATMALAVDRVLSDRGGVRDRVIRLGHYRSNPCRHAVRLLEVDYGATTRRYLTNVLDPAVLSPAQIVDLYARRWRIEEAFHLAKRLLGLSYLWSGTANAIAMQVWATWIFYAVLVDLTDAVAEELDQPLDALSIEMAYRGLYHYTSAYVRGEARDPVAYLASQPSLNLVKAPRPNRDRARALIRPPGLS
jgi:hypothetical protein